jgi:hypothetical protein
MRRSLPVTGALLLLAIVLSGTCGAQQLLSGEDRAYYSGLLAERRARFPLLEADVFSVVDEAKSWEEKAALTFLLATSPLNDLADNSGDFFLSAVRASLETRRRSSWGNRIPDPVFLHFVLPLRVNNEMLDSSRLLFPAQLRPRVDGRTMHDATLEVNHWCHEHVTYAPSDARTRAPLATIRNAKGRCGEESVLTVTALRAAGIPARQVYVPRWAHVDDNHAWVEAWVEGTWHFLGACEPDVDLDRAWFAEPARRAMLTAAIVQGRYRGDVDVLLSGRYSTRINTLPVYADTRVLTVQVVDESGKPAAEAWVDFCLYNYAEFYPLVSTLTDASGAASLRTGRGDLLVWTHLGERYAFAHASHDMRDTVRLVLAAHPAHGERIALDLVPPPEMKLDIPEHPRATETARRIRIGDSLRAQYEAGFTDSARAAAFASALGYAVDSCASLLVRSRGNAAGIMTFLADAVTVNAVPALAFVHALAEKDLQDADARVLITHYREALAARGAEQSCDETFIRYVCSPRIGREELRPWRAALQREISMHPSLRNGSAAMIAAWVRDSIRVDAAENWARVPVPADRVFALRHGDPYSRDVLFVALCRAAGIPARLEPATGLPQYREANDWQNAALDDAVAAPARNAELLLRIPAAQHLQLPRYAIHFTLARFENGRYETLDHEDDPVFERWPVRLPLQPGRYMLTTGNRQPDGSVLASMEFFTLDSGCIAERELHVRSDEDTPAVLGNIDPSLLPATGAKAFVLVWIERGTEPVSHAMLDVAAARAELAEQPAMLLLAGTGGMRDDELKEIARRSLPPNVLTAAEGAPALRANIIERLQLPAGMQLPLIVVCDASGAVTYLARGYTIGVGAQILRILQRMRLAD